MFLQKITHFLHRVYSFFRYGNLRKNTFFISDEKKLVFVVVPKTACSSVKQTFASESEVEHIEDRERLHKQLGRRYGTRKITSEQLEQYFKFTFVRNPFDRLVSCYVHKIKNSDIALRKNYYFFAKIKRQESFESFVKKVARIPDIISDSHFQSQYSILHHRGEPLYDTIGKFEHLKEDFEPIRQKYGLQELPHIHNTKKGDWRAYYTKELADIVYKRYRRDFSEFGYEDEYDKLMSYLEQQNVVDSTV